MKILTAKEIQEEIYKIMERLDEIVLPPAGRETGLYAQRRGNREYMEEKKKGIIAQEKLKQEGSNPVQETKALASKAYHDFIWDMTTAIGLSYQTEAEKNLLEKKLDCYRTLLSYEKMMENANK